MTNCSLTSEAAAKELWTRRRARESILGYVNAIDVPGRPVDEDSDDDQYQPEYDVAATLADHHSLLLRKLDEVSKTRHGRMMVFMPPGSAKSTYASIVFPSRFLGEQPNRKLILASYGDDLARKMGRRTRAIIKQGRYKAIFGAELTRDSQAAQEFSLTNGSEYMACGIRAGVTGNRAHGIIIDDPIKGREQADSQVVRQATWDAYEDDLKTRLIPGGWIVLIQTRWHEDDLAGRILPEAWAGESGKILCRDGNEWEVVCIQAECQNDNDPLGRAKGEYLWPEWFDLKHWEQFRSNSRTWSALYQQQPRPSGGGEFKREWMCYYDSANHTSMARVILVDASSGKNKDRGDYTAFWVVGIGGDGNYYILDIVRDRLNLTARAETLFRLHRKWKPQQVRYEQYGMMADIDHIKKEMESRSYRFRITEVGGATKKEDRIRRLVPLFEHGKMWFPRLLVYTDVNGALGDLVHDFVEQEFLSFPVGKHDDMLDALARIAEPTLELPRPIEDDYFMPVGAVYQPSVASMGL